MDRLTAAHVFIKIAERGSLASAADALQMSRAMVSRYLVHMEEWVGARLLHRTTRRLSLTPDGEQTLLRCRRMLDVADEVPQTRQDTNDPVRGVLRVACAQSLIQESLMPVLSSFLRAHPQLSIDLCIDSRAVHLVEDRIDLAIRITNDLDSNVVARRFGECQSVVCASPAYLATHGVPQQISDLAAHNCLSYSFFGCSLWEFTNGLGEKVNVPVGGNLSANESQVLLEATTLGVGISLQPMYAVAGALARGELEALLQDWQPKPLGIHGIYATRRQKSAALSKLLAALERHFAQPAWSLRGGLPLGV